MSFPHRVLKTTEVALPMLPLEDLRVLDLSRLVAGNMLTLVLADFGAHVVKVEQPGVGDPLRTWKTNNLDLWWRVYARNKRSVTLNLAHPLGRSLLLQMVDRFDVLVENFVPGRLERWEIGPDVLLARNPRLVVVRISGWGQTGPYRERPGLGTLIEAMSGFAAMTGFPDRPPTLPPFPLADMVAALWGAAATVIAVSHARRTGNGQVIDLAILEPLFAILGPLAAEYRLAGQVRERSGNRSYNTAPRNTYKTADGQWVAISASTPHTAARLLDALGLSELLYDPRFATNEARVQHAEALDEILGEAIRRYTLHELMVLFIRHEVTAAPVYNVSQLLADPHVRARDLVIQVQDPQLGGIPMHAPLPRLMGTPGTIRWPGPPLGAHNEEFYLSELGLTRAELERAKAQGVI